MRRRSWGQRSAAVVVVLRSAPHCAASCINTTQACSDVHRGGFAPPLLLQIFLPSFAVYFLSSIETLAVNGRQRARTPSSFSLQTLFHYLEREKYKFIMLGYSCMVLGQKGTGEEQRGYWTVWGSLARFHMAFEIRGCS